MIIIIIIIIITIIIVIIIISAKLQTMSGNLGNRWNYSCSTFYQTY